MWGWARSAAMAAACIWAHPASAYCTFYSTPLVEQLEATGRADPERADADAKRALASPAMHQPQRRADHVALLLYLASQTGVNTPDGSRYTHLVRSLLSDKNDIARLQLALMRSPELPDYVAQIDAARKRFSPNAYQNACAMLYIGTRLFDQNDVDGAVRNIVPAYKVMTELDRPAERMVAAQTLATVFFRAGDYPRTKMMLEEVTQEARRYNNEYVLGVYTYYWGKLFAARKRHEQAIAAFSAALPILERHHVENILGATATSLCQENVELHRYAAATRACDRAAAIWNTGIDRRKVEAIRARIAAAQGRSREALALLDHVLTPDSHDPEIPQYLSPAYDLRADVRAALGDWRGAYGDLRHHLTMFRSMNDAERTRQNATLRAQFETDRQIGINAALSRELKLNHDRETARRHLMLVGTLSALAVIALLGYILKATRHHERELTRLAESDELTGLPNRRHIGGLAAGFIERSDPTGKPTTVAIIDLDHFKSVNDTWGHQAGDLVLQRFAETTRSVLRGRDQLGRWGGEEFLLVLPAADLSEAVAVLDRVREAAAAAPFDFDPDFRVRFSAGIACFTQIDHDLDDLINRADLALYAAKEGGRNQSRIGTN